MSKNPTLTLDTLVKKRDMNLTPHSPLVAEFLAIATKLERENAELRRELDEAYEKCADIAGRIARSERDMAEAHHRHSKQHYDMEDFGFSHDVVRYSRDCEQRILGLKSTRPSEG